MVSTDKMFNTGGDKSPSPEPFREPHGLINVDLQIAKKNEGTKEHRDCKRKLEIILGLFIFNITVLAVLLYVNQEIYLYRAKSINGSQITDGSIEKVIENRTIFKTLIKECLLTKKIKTCCELFGDADKKIQKFCILKSFLSTKNQLRRKRNIKYETAGKSKSKSYPEINHNRVYGQEIESYIYYDEPYYREQFVYYDDNIEYPDEYHYTGPQYNTPDKTLPAHIDNTQILNKNTADSTKITDQNIEIFNKNLDTHLTDAEAIDKNADHHKEVNLETHVTNALAIDKNTDGHKEVANQEHGTVAIDKNTDWNHEEHGTLFTSKNLDVNQKPNDTESISSNKTAAELFPNRTIQLEKEKENKTEAETKISSKNRK